MTTMSYDDDMGRIQRTLSQCHDLVMRRTRVIQELNLRSGLSVLEVGCGGGFYAAESARSVGSSGRVCAIDLSADQIAAATERCAEFPWVELTVGTVTEMPYEDGQFDVVYGTQVIEYVAELDEALHEICRVLRPGGRVVILATNWRSVVWHSNKPERMAEILEAWDTHSPYPYLPSILPARLRQAGIETLYQTPVPIINLSYNENAFSYWAARLMRHFLIGKNLIDEAVLNLWIDEFDELEKQGAYAFYSTPIITVGIKSA